MSFFVHSQKVRWEKEREEAHQREVVIAKAALAGWHWVQFAEKPSFGGGVFYMLIDPQGKQHGNNTTIYGAACYALQEMERQAQSEEVPF